MFFTFKNISESQKAWLVGHTLFIWKGCDQKATLVLLWLAYLTVRVHCSKDLLYFFYTVFNEIILSSRSSNISSDTFSTLKLSKFASSWCLTNIMLLHDSGSQPFDPCTSKENGLDIHYLQRLLIFLYLTRDLNHLQPTS